MSKIADDSEAIARRMKELEAERNLALTGSTLTEEPKAEQPTTGLWGMYGTTTVYPGSIHVNSYDYDPS